MSISSIDQCAFGAPHHKPTSIMHGHMEALNVQLQARGISGRCPHPPGTHRPLRGQREGGGWNTSPAKSYPSALCQVLGFTIAERIAELRPWAAATSSDPNEDLAAFYATLDRYATVPASFGPDTFRPGR